MAAATSESSSGTSLDNLIKLNVGGKLFETTLSSIHSGGSDSLLATLSCSYSSDINPVFIDRDPEIFSVLLSLLRTNRLPSAARDFSKQELADEALYYGIDAQLRSAMAVLPLDGIDASITATIQPASDGMSSAFTADEVDGSIWIAHGGQITCYDLNLSHSCSIRTRIDEIDSICRVCPEIAAIGSESNAGLHFYELSGGRNVGTVQWIDRSDPRIFKARVNAIAGSASSMFAAFDCPHGENCILEVDKMKLQIVSQFGRQSGNQAKHKVPGKLTWVPQIGVLVGSAVTSGAFGYSGYIRLWDPRSSEVVWETNEPGAGRSSRFGDSFACVDVDVEGLALFKLCSQSGDLAIADMRYLKEDPWIYMQEKNPSLVNTRRVSSSVIHCYRRQVFVGREGDLEVWSRFEGMKHGAEIAGGDVEGSYRRNFVDKIENAERGIIKQIEGGGNRLFVSREDVEGIEVWESSCSSGAISVL